MLVDLWVKINVTYYSNVLLTRMLLWHVMWHLWWVRYLPARQSTSRWSTRDRETSTLILPDIWPSNSRDLAAQYLGKRRAASTSRRRMEAASDRCLEWIGTRHKQLSWCVAQTSPWVCLQTFSAF